MTMGQLRALPHVEYVQWRAFYVYEAKKLKAEMEKER